MEGGQPGEGLNDAAVITGCTLTSSPTRPKHTHTHPGGGDWTGGVYGWVGGGEEVVIDAAPGVQGPRSVIVINNGVLAIWLQTGHFVCPQSSLDKWREGEVGGGAVQALRIKRNRCSREESPRWEAAAGNMLFFVSPLVFTSRWASASWESQRCRRSLLL